ncbi:hypothetical protein OsJ_11356 [Oryza sativa Japonica Group]|uniref:Expansin n=1 Tax=Oryza sativa subsp. japonica TaxID=39947 RepID=A3AJC1_ORYSJ|nr:hypothetical protein OsJ_11356 [Oryza sativa Japonica Group]
MAMSSRLALCLAVVAACAAGGAVADWSPATATFYGGSDGSGTMGGACGYGNLYDQGYGVDNAALSQALFNDGASCGAVLPDRLRHEQGAAVVQGRHGGDRDGDQPVPAQLGAPERRRRVVQTRRGRTSTCRSRRGSRSACTRPGSCRCCTSGGSVASAWIKGTNTGWIQMSRNWGANWQSLAGLAGQALSFAVTTTGGQYLQFQDVAPAWWQFGQTFSTYQQFDY